MANPPIQVDLNELQRTILKSQERDEALPARQKQKVYVDDKGNIVLGDAVRPGDEQHLSQVHQGVFASAPTRLERDRSVVGQKFPQNTRELTVDGVTGWVYSFVDPLNARYTMFAYHDGDLYQVKVLFPEVEGKYSPHDGHLYPDGCICFDSRRGLPELEQAYAKSVLWGTGFTAYCLTKSSGGQFPFSRNNFQ